MTIGGGGGIIYVNFIRLLSINFVSLFQIALETYYSYYLELLHINPMKELFFLLLISFIIYKAEAQQEPQWLMPFYFETADGQKDTIYIGYDPSASEIGGIIDEQFYDIEQFVTPNLDFFNVYVEGSLGYGYGYGASGTDIRKVTIRNDLIEYTYINFIGTGTFPITMKWGYTQLYSENLPGIYPYIPDRPRARIDIYPEVGCFPSCIGDCYYTLTDSLYPEINDYMAWDCMGIITDSVVFECNGPYNVQEGQGMMIRIRQYDTIAHWWEDTKIDNEFIKDIRTYPNPANSYVKIENLPVIDLKVSFYDMTGRVAMLYTCFRRKEIKINIQALKNGIYLLRISNKNNTSIYSNKIIKI
jgi:hypothetical protein